MMEIIGVGVGFELSSSSVVAVEESDEVPAVVVEGAEVEADEVEEEERRREGANGIRLDTKPATEWVYRYPWIRGNVFGSGRTIGRTPGCVVVVVGFDSASASVSEEEDEEVDAEEEGKDDWGREAQYADKSGACVG